MSNNDILKKLRIALHLRNTDIIQILELVDFRITESELGAIFRNQDHENFKPCGDQILRNFLNGLIIHLRGPRDANAKPSRADVEAIMNDAISTGTVEAEPRKAPRLPKTHRKNTRNEGQRPPKPRPQNQAE
jgi:hypothetical protein